MLNHFRILPLAAVLLAFFSLEATAQPVQELVVVDSKRELENQVAAILKERFKLNASLQVVNDDPDDLIAAIRIAASPEQNVPAITMHVNSTITLRRKDEVQTPVVQILSFASTADVTVRPDKEMEILRLVNVINAQALPAHVYVANSRIVLVQNMTLQNEAPISAAQVGANFVNVVRTWPVLLGAFRKHELLADE